MLCNTWQNYYVWYCHVAKFTRFVIYIVANLHIKTHYREKLLYELPFVSNRPQFNKISKKGIEQKQLVEITEKMC